LSTSGTVKAYSVVAWLANLPESQKDNHKPAFVNFKNVVWHKAFYILLESIIKYVKTGFWFKCADKILQLLFPMILILSGDYEEQ
ncbi:hypothetical protein PAXRUDRAFT_153342, partial [Paxillus rubicundulus Ve08.2h10]